MLMEEEEEEGGGAEEAEGGGGARRKRPRRSHGGSGSGAASQGEADSKRRACASSPAPSVPAASGPAAAAAVGSEVAHGLAVLRGLRSLPITAQLELLDALDGEGLAALPSSEVIAMLGELTRTARLATRLAQAAHHAQQTAIHSLAARDVDGA